MRTSFAEDRELIQYSSCYLVNQSPELRVMLADIITEYAVKISIEEERTTKSRIFAREFYRSNT